MQKTPDMTGGRLQFADLELRDRFETSLACEIWLDDACNARWATNNTMKLAAVVAQAIKNNDGRPLELSRLDTLCAMSREDACLALRQMHMFGLIAGFKLDAGLIALTCRLSHAGEVRFLDMRQRFDLLEGLRRQSAPAAEAAPARREIASSRDVPQESTHARSNIVVFRHRNAGRCVADLACGGSVA
jgi:hypothetical protein